MTVATVDLSTPLPPTGGPLDNLPRRVTLTLPELRLVAQAAGGAPLPFETPSETTDEPLVGGGLEGRLGQSGGSREAEAYAAALASLRKPEPTLTRRGLLVGDEMDAALVGAVGLLATPSVAVDLDVAVGAEADERGTQVKAWHRQSGSAVSTLATADGVVFELAWFPVAHWAEELGRAAMIPEHLRLSSSGAPRIDLPFELLDAAAEAVRTGRPDLLPVLAAQVTGTLMREPDLVRILQALSDEARGRLRAMVARVDADTNRPAREVREASEAVTGVVSWTLLADGWRSLRTHERDGALWVDVRPVRPNDLAGDLAPALAQVKR